MHICVHLHIYIPTYLPTYVRTDRHTHMHAHTCTYVYMSFDLASLKYVNMHMRTYAHMKAHQTHTERIGTLTMQTIYGSLPKSGGSNMDPKQ